MFDKTGTLTCGGEPVVTDHWLLDNSRVESSGSPWLRDVEEDIVEVVRQVESNSSHTVAKALVSFCGRSKEVVTQEMQHLTNVSTAKVERTSKVIVDEVEEVAGKGMRGKYNSATMDVMIGNEALMEDYSVLMPEDIREILKQWKTEGKSVALAAISSTSCEEKVNWVLVAAFAISDPIRPEAPAIIKALREGGTDVWMLSGDNRTTGK